MATIIYKPQGVEFKKVEIDNNIIFKKPYSVNYVYAANDFLYVKKNRIYNKKVWNEIESLTEFPVVIHFNDDDKKILDLKPKNWCPIKLNEKIALVSAGELIKVKGSLAQDYSNLKVLVDQNLSKIVKSIPSFLFTSYGQWIVENVIYHTSAMIAINNKGEVTVFNQKQGEVFEKLWYFDSFLATAHNQVRFWGDYN